MSGSTLDITPLPPLLKKMKAVQEKTINRLLFCQGCSSEPDSNEEKMKVKKREQRDIMLNTFRHY